MIVSINGQERHISKTVLVRIPKKIFTIEEMSDGKLRLTYSSAFLNGDEDFNYVTVKTEQEF
jgi:hypothetical protein